MIILPECSKDAPNFWHKPSGLKIWWYKYIGRGMDFHIPEGVNAVEIIRSLYG